MEDEKKGTNVIDNVAEIGERGEMDELHIALANMKLRAYKLQQICDKILKESYAENQIVFPIDIEKIAHAQGIELEYENLNCGGIEEIDLNIAQLRYVEEGGGNVVRKIYVDKSQKMPYEKAGSESYSNLQKYAIAYELGKTIVNEECGIDISKLTAEDIMIRNRNSVPYSLPKLYARQENFEYEMCAIFLLLPLDLFFEEFSSYLNNRTYSPVYMERWIKHLSDKTEIPNYQLINGYQYIKFCACQYYQSKRDEIAEKDYWDLYQ